METTTKNPAHETQTDEMKNALRNFCESSSIHGLSQIAKQDEEHPIKSKLRQILWAIACLCCLSFMLIQVRSSIEE